MMETLVPGLYAILIALAGWIAANTRRIDKAVNGVPKTDPTLSQRVCRIEETLSRIEQRLDSLPPDSPTE